MGLSLEFIAGPEHAVQEAIAGNWYDWLLDRDDDLLRADFSLHLIPTDLDRLSECFGEVTGRNSTFLRPHLKVVVDTEDGGILSVAPDWVKYVSVCDLESVDVITNLWCQKMEKDHEGENLTPTEEMRAAVSALIALTVAAVRLDLAVVHGWHC
ncbi:hypothetical protein [Brevifollis gellanilyticus]|nr:hypothetical protein [Brevifollis gellanilyticus]